ncbi:citrate synthase/methylcitrate synthase [Calidifontibacter sp. DB0510]|uniref:Citrate synthase n=1 Tax=Metallococcus carri TaxID=1656884 RepID=A0A967E951_9MICO|nr:citrate/2-methylcitrate synthase [Metallococcus carri]NHN55982.1 citrate synthase/methylcitrate synthase [Metallococcus carri]NOP37561.1 citrate synthase/methylcitrate synthase [Calidifontibacter sp. DB2511S]
MDTFIAPPGLSGVVVADTTIGDVRGTEGFFHYRQYDATTLARTRSFEDVWHLMIAGSLPDATERAAWSRRIEAASSLEPQMISSLTAVMSSLRGAEPMAALRTLVSAYGVLAGLPALWDQSAAEREETAVRIAAIVPWLVAGSYAVSAGEQPRSPRPSLGFVGNYLWLVTGEEPSQEAVRALSRYLCLTVDHGFNASTFTARVVASTGADLAACVVAGLGALSGPLHGGAPSRALDALDEIGSIERAEPWAREQLAAGERVMGFGHAVYRGLDPRSELLKETAREIGGPTAELALEVEDRVVAVLDEHKPGRQLRANVEYYAGVVMEACGIPRSLFSATFACSRTVGWTAHILEQCEQRKLIRPSSRYVGPPVLDNPTGPNLAG